MTPQDEPAGADALRADRLRSLLDSPHVRRAAVAVAVAVARGVPRRRVLPPLCAVLIARGLPVRPPHYRSTASLFLWGVLPVLLIFGGLLESGLPALADDGLPRMLHDAGWPGILAVAYLVGMLNVIVTEREARRHGLPSWDEV